MKKNTFILLCVIAFMSGKDVFAQKKNAVKLPMVSIFGGQYQLAYERSVAEKFSVGLSGGYIRKNTSQSWDDDYYGDETSYNASTTGFLVVPEARYYFKEAIKGMYLGAFLRYKHTKQDLTDTSFPMYTDVSRTVKTTSYGGGVVFGWQFLISDAFVIDMFMGPIFKGSSEKKTYKNLGVSDEDFDYKFLDFKALDASPVGVRAGVSLGFAF